MLNFAMRSGGIDMLISSWFSPILPFPNSTGAAATLICPDFDERARSTLGYIKSLRYCVRQDGYQQIHLNVSNFMELLHVVVKHQRYSRRIPVGIV
jgi:hypothetical protein